MAQRAAAAAAGQNPTVRIALSEHGMRPVTPCAAGEAQKAQPRAPTLVAHHGLRWEASLRLVWAPQHKGTGQDAKQSRTAILEGGKADCALLNPTPVCVCLCPTASVTVRANQAKQSAVLYIRNIERAQRLLSWLIPAVQPGYVACPSNFLEPTNSRAAQRPPATPSVQTLQICARSAGAMRCSTQPARCRRCAKAAHVPPSSSLLRPGALSPTISCRTPAAS